MIRLNWMVCQGGSDTFKTISVSGQDDVAIRRQCDRYPYIVIVGVFLLQQPRRAIQLNFVPGGAHSISPLEWTASSNAHSCE